MGDHRRVLGGHGPLGERVGGGREPVVEVRGQPHRPRGGGASGPGLPREPRPRGRAPGGRGHPRPLRRGDQLELQRVQPGPRSCQLGDRPGVLVRSQPLDHDPVERLVHRRHHRGRMTGCGVEVEGN